MHPPSARPGRAPAGLWCRALALLGLAALAACVEATPPPPRPAPAAVAPAPPGRSETSLRLSRYYAGVQQDLQARGMLRTDPGREFPLPPEKVVQTFLNIAFYSEYTERGGRFLSLPAASRLQKWQVPISMRVVTGPSLPPAQATRDRGAVGDFAARLARITGHPIRMVGAGGNFAVLILNEDERLGFGEELDRLMPGLTPATRRAVLDMPLSTYCLVIARGSGEGTPYTQAVAVIRAEHPDLMRLACIHEELAQGLGLANDDPKARPSIFNDDEEFALLTGLDELLLRILYDSRLHSGMTEAEAAPIVRRIVAEKLPGPV